MSKNDSSTAIKFIVFLQHEICIKSAKVETNRLSGKKSIVRYKFH